MSRSLALLLLGLATPALAQQTHARICYVVCDPWDPRTLDGLNVCDGPDTRPAGRAATPHFYSDSGTAAGRAPRRRDGRTTAAPALRAPRAAAIHRRRAL